jgi:hypothetical protein
VEVPFKNEKWYFSLVEVGKHSGSSLRKQKQILQLGKVPKIREVF